MNGQNFRVRAVLPVFLRRLIVVLVFVLFILWGITIWSQFDGLMRSYAAVWGRDVAARSVNAALMQVLADAPSLETLSTDTNGRILALTVDGIKASKLKAAVALAISDQLGLITEERGTVPLGTLLGSHLLRGRGPDVHFRLTPVGSTQVELTSRFIDAGINQTCHQLVLCVETTVTVLLPGMSLDRSVKQEAILSETIIVGETPPVYLTSY